MAVFNNILAGAAGSGGAAGYEIERSLRFNSADSAYLNRTPSSASNRKTWTWSGWVKRTNPGTGNYLFMCQVDSSNYSEIYFDTDDKIKINNRVSGSDVSKRITSAVYRDVSAWYHVVVASDSSTLLKLYVNGAEVTDFSTSTGPTTADWSFNSTSAHSIGANNTGTGYHLNGYLADIHFIDGQALAATDFGEYDDNNVWQAKLYSGTYGTNGFHLDFSDNSSAAALGTDTSGNSNTWTVNNLSVASGADNDSLIDTPTNYTAASGNNGGNYCTLNPLDVGSATPTILNGNLEAKGNSDNSITRATQPITSGKYYWEFKKLHTGTGDWHIGVTITATASELGTGYIGSTATGWAIHANPSGSSYWRHNGNTAVHTFSSINQGDIVMLAVDADAGKIYVGSNGTWFLSGDPASGTGAASTNLPTDGTAIFPTFMGYDTTGVAFNFGQRAFAYTAPSGFKALCTANLPDPTIADGSTAFAATTYTGNGASSRAITGVGHSPDFFWVKSRGAARPHNLQDSVRGVGNYLISNASNAEGTGLNDGLISLDSDGFTIGNNAVYNNNNEAYVAWTWDGGTSTVSNTDGSITSSVRANQTAGFSIVTWTGTATAGTVGHGLGASPDLLILKNYGESADWMVWHSAFGSAGSGEHLSLNTTNAKGTPTSRALWNNTLPTNSVFSIGTDGHVNSSGKGILALCFSAVEGYSAFGSYEGTGNSDGPFVFCGFKPRVVIYKNADATEGWGITDTARSVDNPADEKLEPNTDSAEAIVTNRIDVLSNGFKIRAGSAQSPNVSGNTYIYAAFAENPFKTARAR